VLFPETLLPGKWREDRYDLGHHSLSPKSNGAYNLMDSWYTNPSVLDACQEKRCHLIGAMKTNRILFPEGKRTPACDLAASLVPGCFHPVTVKGRTYMVYRYEEPLNKIDHAVVLLSYPAAAMGICQRY
jgi:hypothetical protein